MSKIRWIVLLLLITSLIFSCATYTSNMGYEKIILENDGNYKETRLQGIIEEKARLAEEARLEAERIENEKRLAEEAEKERLAEEARKEAERAEQERLAEEARKEAERAEQERLAEEARKEAERAEQERLAEEARKEAERLEQERLAEEARKEAERAEQERLAEEARLEAERAEQERLAEEARLEAERAEQERLAEEARLEAERKEKENALLQSLAKARRINSYPSDLASLTIPHIYRPVDNPILKDDSFTQIETLFIPLGSSENDLDAIISSISDLNVDFIFITGALEDRVYLSKKLAKDTVTLNGGSIIFNTQLLDSNSDVASFKISENKDIELSVVALSDKSAVTAKSVNAWREYIEVESQKDTEKVLTTAQKLTDSEAILALSSSQPSSLDWSIFTPYSYRTEASFTISDELNKTMSDTYRATHFSEETDGGITLITPVLSERLDFLYSKGIIEVSSSTVALSGLSNMDIERFAILATYIIP